MQNKLATDSKDSEEQQQQQHGTIALLGSSTVLESEPFRQPGSQGPSSPVHRAAQHRTPAHSLPSRARTCCTISACSPASLQLIT